MKILICGAGVAGLSMAAHLQESSHEVTIIEKAHEFKNIGFVLGIWAMGLETLKEFNIYSEVEKVGHFPTRFDLFNRDGNLISHFNFEDLAKFYGKAVMIRRADLQKILIKINKKTKISFNLSVTNIVNGEDSATAHFSDGTEKEFDLIIGADGIHSSVRQMVFGNSGLNYSGISSWLYLLPKNYPHRINDSAMWSQGKFFGAYPYSHHNYVHVIFAKACKLEQVPEKELAISMLRKDFGNFKWIVPETLASMKDSDSIFETPWMEVKLKFWSKGRVVLIGDAAHAMLPLSGSGATLAMEDAFVLANLIKDDTSLLVPMVLEKFHSIRNPVVEGVRSKSDFVASLIKLGWPYSVGAELMKNLIPAPIVKEELGHMLSLMAIASK